MSPHSAQFNTDKNPLFSLLLVVWHNNAEVVVVKDVFVLLDRLITLDLQSDAIAAHAIQQVEDMLSSVASGSSSEEFIRLQTFDKKILTAARQSARSYKLETILDLPVHFCSGVLSNAGAAVGLTLIQDRGVLDQGSDKRKAIFVLEVAERTPLQCIATMLMRSLELRNIVLEKSDSVGTARVVRVVLAEDDGKADDSGGGGIDQQTEDLLEPGARCAGADETGEDEYEIREDDDDDGIMLELQTLPPPLALKLIDQSAVDRFRSDGHLVIVVFGLHFKC